MTARATRRQMFGSSAAMLVLACPAAGAIKAAEIDGELLAACAQFQQLQVERVLLHPIADVMPPTPRSIQAEETLDALREEEDNLGDIIAKAPARTPEGLQAKAAAILAFWGGSSGRDPLDLSCVHERMEWSLVQDVAGRRGA